MFKTIARMTLDRAFNKSVSKISRGLEVLDIGAKDAPYREKLNAKKYTTLDIDESFNPDICCDAHNMPIEDGTYDVVIATEFLEHCYEPKRAVSEIHRVLRKNGTVILSTRFVKEIHGEPYDYFRFTRYGLQELFKDFRVVEITELGNGLSAIWDLVCYYIKPLIILNTIIYLFSGSRDSSAPNGYLVYAIK